MVISEHGIFHTFFLFFKGNVETRNHIIIIIN